MTVRIFHDGPLVEGATLAVTGDEHHYLRRVRRARTGAAIEILDGRGAAAAASVEHVDDRHATVRVERLLAQDVDAPLELWLGIPDGPACLDAITVACELGCANVVLVRCAHSPATVPNTARIDRVVRAAMRQCGLASPPSLRGPTALDALLAEHEIPCGHFAWERLRGTATPVDAALPRRLLVGPEGGLAPHEAAMCRARGMQPLSLGPWTLRTQTAVAAGLARLRGAWPDCAMPDGCGTLPPSTRGAP